MEKLLISHKILFGINQCTRWDLSFKTSMNDVTLQIWNVNISILWPKEEVPEKNRVQNGIKWLKMEKLLFSHKILFSINQCTRWDLSFETSMNAIALQIRKLNIQCQRRRRRRKSNIYIELCFARSIIIINWPQKLTDDSEIDSTDLGLL